MNARIGMSAQVKGYLVAIDSLLDQNWHKVTFS